MISVTSSVSRSFFYLGEGSVGLYYGYDGFGENRSWCSRHDDLNIGKYNVWPIYESDKE